MNEIFTVCVIANYHYDNEGEKTPCPPEEKTWVDSYWTNEADALAEAERLWNNDYDELLDEVRVFGRKLNVKGNGFNDWICERDRLIKYWF